jgi:hypothetical protein
MSIAAVVSERSSSGRVSQGRTKVIDGLKLDVKSEELVARLDERIAVHRAKVEAYGAQLRKLGDIGPDPDDDDVVAELRGGGSPRHGLERKHQRHIERVEWLTFVRDHLVSGEVYRMSEEDLRFAELLPDRCRW